MRGGRDFTYSSQTFQHHLVYRLRSHYYSLFADVFWHTPYTNMASYWGVVDFVDLAEMLDFGIYEFSSLLVRPKQRWSRGTGRGWTTKYRRFQRDLSRFWIRNLYSGAERPYGQTLEETAVDHLRLAETLDRALEGRA